MKTAVLAISSTLLLLASGAAALSSSSHGFSSNRVRDFRGHGVRLSQDKSASAVIQHWFDGAVVDNFAPVDMQTHWSQRYWVNAEFWGGPGYPVFLYIGGEGPESGAALTSTLFMYSLAQEHKALMFDLEHRFYGSSYPTPNMDKHNLRELTSDQALADAARFISHVSDAYNAHNSEWLAFGGSYPGNLAAWIRLKYPHLIHGSVASSAPVKAKPDFEEYMQVVGDALRFFGGAACYDAVESAMRTYAGLVAAEDWSQLQADFDLCGPISSPLDLWVVESDLMGNFQGAAQYNMIYGNMTVSVVCDTMTASADYYGNLKTLSAMFLQSNGYTCLDQSWDNTVTSMTGIEFDGESAMRQWTYQSCNEFGYFQTSTGLNQPFYNFKTLTLESYYYLCDVLFGIDRSPLTRWTNSFYGSVGIDVTNVVFPSGTIDPWHALGIYNATPLAEPQSSTSAYIVGTAHCADMHSPSESDPASLTAAREVISQQVSRFLAPRPQAALLPLA